MASQAKPAQGENGRIVIDNFGGRKNQYVFGNPNSGFVPPYPGLTYGADPFIYPGRLTWVETPTQIDPAGSVITDLIVAAKERIEGNITYVYAVGHFGRVYKIQVNDPSTYNPDYDNPVLLATISINTPTFTRGGSIEFFGTTEKLIIGHDVGATSLNFDGSGEAFIGVVGSWVQNVPRPFLQFVGNMYAGNGTNIAEISSSFTVNTYAKLTPGFPIGMQNRDLDVSSDGNYLQATVTRLSLPDITSVTQDDKFLGSTESYIYEWNGGDITYSASKKYPSFSLNANHTFGDKEYVFGYDISGGAIFNPTDKILTHFLAKSPLPNAVISNGNHVGWMVPENFGGFTKASLSIFGALDMDVKEGWWKYFDLAAMAPETDVVSVPCFILVSGFVLGSSTNGYAGGVASTGKLYFSTLEASTAPTTKYRFYKWHPLFVNGLSTPIQGVYQTQTQLFSKKVKVGEIRIYANPLVAGNSFQIGLIGGEGVSTGTPIVNSTKVFTVGTNATAGDDLLLYSPQMDTTYAIGVQILNLGTTNMVINKIEIDYAEGGK